MSYRTSTLETGFDKDIVYITTNLSSRIASRDLSGSNLSAGSTKVAPYVNAVIMEITVPAA